MTRWNDFDNLTLNNDGAEGVLSSRLKAEKVHVRDRICAHSPFKNCHSSIHDSKIKGILKMLHSSDWSHSAKWFCACFSAASTVLFRTYNEVK